MSEVRDASFAIKAAEEAAAAGDFPTAEQYLSRAVELEELSFGPMHAELASILNNLGVVSERLNRPDKAEACYRRAYAIARASLPPGDPGIELSATNLRDFCAARGILFEPTSAQGATVDTPASANGAIADKPAAKVAPAWPPSSLRTVEEPVAAVPKKAPAEPERPRDAVPIDALAPAPLMAPRTLAIAALVVVAVIVGVVFFATRSSSPTSQSAPAPTPAAVTPVQEPAPAPPPAVTSDAAAAPVPQDSTPAEAPPGPLPQAAALPKTAPAPAPPVARRQPSAASAVVPTLVSAQLCRSIETAGGWRCTPANGHVAPGPVVFYTRLNTPANTAVEHRWYRGDRLQQKMTLRIRPNPGAGYRTYSRATVGAAPGEWRVELRAMNGSVLHEERFTVGP